MNLKPYKDYYSISPSRHIALYTPASLEYTVYIIIIRIISLHTPPPLFRNAHPSFNSAMFMLPPSNFLILIIYGRDHLD